MRYAVICLLAVFAIGATADQTAPTADRDAWDREGAARYLDGRMDAWFTTATKLRTGQTQTTCVSCHTAVPYALARPALRRAMQGSTATPQEIKLLEETTRRVQTYSTHQLLYELNERKKAESRGTEAVLNGLILANADAAANRRVSSEATRNAIARVWETQRPDGAWDWLDFGLEPFETVDSVYYGATLAALAVGTAPGFPTDPASRVTVGTEKLRGYLKEHYPAQHLFNRTWLLLASTRLSELLTRAERDALIAEIQSRQHDDGGWSLDELGGWKWSKTVAPFAAPGTLDATLLKAPDGYATGLIVFTLRQAGLAADHPAVKKGLQWLRANQREMPMSDQPGSAWRAHSLNFDREHGGPKGEPWRRLFMSDVATAFAVLGLTAAN